MRRGAQALVVGAHWVKQGFLAFSRGARQLSHGFRDSAVTQKLTHERDSEH